MADIAKTLKRNAHVWESEVEEVKKKLSTFFSKENACDSWKCCSTLDHNVKVEVVELGILQITAKITEVKNCMMSYGEGLPYYATVGDARSCMEDMLQAIVEKQKMIHDMCCKYSMMTEVNDTLWWQYGHQNLIIKMLKKENRELETLVDHLRSSDGRKFEDIKRIEGVLNLRTSEVVKLRREKADIKKKYEQLCSENIKLQQNFDLLSSIVETQIARDKNPTLFSPGPSGTSPDSPRVIYRADSSDEYASSPLDGSPFDSMEILSQEELSEIDGDDSEFWNSVE